MSYQWTGQRRVEDALRLLFFPNDPYDMRAIVLIKKGNMEGEILYDGQVRPLFWEKEFRYLLELPCIGWLADPSMDFGIKVVFVPEGINITKHEEEKK